MGGILIVNFPADHATTPGILLGWRDALDETLRRPEAGVGHGEGSEHPVVEEAVELCSGHALDDLGPQDCSEVRIRVGGTGVTLQVRLVDVSQRGSGVLGFRVQRYPCL